MPDQPAEGEPMPSTLGSVRAPSEVGAGHGRVAHEPQDGTGAPWEQVEALVLRVAEALPELDPAPPRPSARPSGRVHRVTSSKPAAVVRPGLELAHHRHVGVLQAGPAHLELGDRRRARRTATRTGWRPRGVDEALAAEGPAHLAPGDLPATARRPSRRRRCGRRPGSGCGRRASRPRRGRGW